MKHEIELSTKQNTSILAYVNRGRVGLQIKVGKALSRVELTAEEAKTLADKINSFLIIEE